MTQTYYPGPEFRVFRPFLYKVQLAQAHATGVSWVLNTFTFIFDPEPDHSYLGFVDVVFNPFFVEWRSDYWAMKKLVISTSYIDNQGYGPVPWNILIEWNQRPDEDWGYIQFRNPDHPDSDYHPLPLQGAPDDYWIAGVP
jgi:hypothetical protein